MHRAALTPAQTVTLAEKLCHRLVQRRPHREDRSMPSIGACHGVAVAKDRARSDGDRLLSLTEVRAAAHEIAGEQRQHLVFEVADLGHASEQIEYEFP